LTEIISQAEGPKHLGTQSCLRGNDEVGMAEEDFEEGGEAVEACVQKKQIALLEVLDEFVDEFVFRGGMPCRRRSAKGRG